MVRIVCVYVGELPAGGREGGYGGSEVDGWESAHRADAAGLGAGEARAGDAR